MGPDKPPLQVKRSRRADRGARRRFRRSDVSDAFEFIELLCDIGYLLSLPFRLLGALFDAFQL